MAAFFFALLAEAVAVAGSAAFWASQASQSGSPIWPLPALMLLDWGALGLGGVLFIYLGQKTWVQRYDELAWVLAGALLPLVYFGALSIGPYVLISALLLLIACLLTLFREKHPFSRSAVAFILGGLVNLGLVYALIRFGIPAG
jgi:hypothetical protein